MKRISMVLDGRAFRIITETIGLSQQIVCYQGNIVGTKSALELRFMLSPYWNGLLVHTQKRIRIWVKSRNYCQIQSHCQYTNHFWRFWGTKISLKNHLLANLLRYCIRSQDASQARGCWMSTDPTPRICFK